MELTVLIPARNEAENLAVLIPELDRTLDQLGIQYEILVVDGGSVDNTVQAASGSSRSVRVMQQREPGYGKAILEGVAASRGEYILTMDADLSHDPESVRTLWDARYRAEIIIGSRYMAGGKAEMPFLRLLLSRVLNIFFRRGLSLPWHDLSSGLRLYRRAHIASLPVNRADFDILQEILIRSHTQGLTVHEVPIHYRPRRSGSSNARVFRFGMAYLKTYWRMWRLRNSILSADYDDRAYDSLIPLQRFWQRRRCSILRKFAANRGRTLDIGCGSSRVLSFAELNLTGLDIQLNKLRYSRKFGRPLLNGTIWSLPFPDAVFDCVVCSEVIEHIASGNAPFLEMRRVLKPGGTLVLGTPDYGPINWRMIEAAYKFIVPGGYADEHITQYTFKSLRDLVESLGFQVQQWEYILNAELIFQCVLKSKS